MNLMTKDKLYSIIKDNATHISDDIIISDNSHLIEDLEYDSVDLMQLLIDIEDEFGIDFLNADLLTEKLSTVGEIFELLSGRIGEKQ